MFFENVFFIYPILFSEDIFSKDYITFSYEKLLECTFMFMALQSLSIISICSFKDLESIFNAGMFMVKSLQILFLHHFFILFALETLSFLSAACHLLFMSLNSTFKVLPLFLYSSLSGFLMWPRKTLFSSLTLGLGKSFSLSILKIIWLYFLFQRSMDWS